MADTNLGFIQEVSSGLPRSQLAAVQALLEEKRLAGQFTNKLSFDKSVLALRNRLKANGRAFVFQPAPKRGVISSSYLNDIFESIKLDLDVLYSQMGIISSDNSRMKAVVNDGFIKTKTNITNLISQLRLFRFIKLNPSFQDAKYIEFGNATNRTPFKPKAYVDTTTRTLKLPVSTIQRLAVSRFNLDKVDVEAVHFGGGISGRDNVNFGPQNSLDDNPETFYGDIILSDGHPNHTRLLSHSSVKRKLGSGTQDGHKFSSNGILFQLQYSFAKTASCNQLRLFPIADFPLKLIDLCYKTTDSSEDWIPIPKFDPNDYEETLDWIEWNGDRFYMTQLRVVFEQANYTTNIYHIPSDLLTNNQLWSQILDTSFQESIHNIELDEVVADKIAANPELLLYLNELNDLGTEISGTSLDGEQLREYDLSDKLNEVVARHMAKVNPELSSEANVSSLSNAPLTEVRRLQFVGGLRVIEVNDNTYQPFGFYESPKFDSNANVLELQLSTTESHQTVPDSIIGKPYQQTSTEWEIEAGQSIFFPIVPIENKIETADGIMVEVKDELLILNRSTNAAVTRFEKHAGDPGNSSIQIRKNGIRLNPIHPNSGFGRAVLQANYTVTTLSNNHLKIVFNEKYFDQRAVYTVSYMAHENSSIIDINARLNSEFTTEPETFTGVDKDNKVKLNFFPYVEYSVVNDETNWAQPNDDVPKWEFAPATSNYSLGTAGIRGDDLFFVTGNGTNWAAEVDALVTGTINGLTGAAIQFLGDTRAYTISGVTSNSGLTTWEPIETGFLPATGEVTGLPYVIGKVEQIDGTIYGLNNTVYEPVTVYVNDVKASNRTNYNTLEHQAFTPVSSSSRIFEYIQAGKRIYFNASVDGKIEVSYNYLTEYLKVNATLRSHKTVNPVSTPVVDDFSLRIKNSKI